MLDNLPFTNKKFTKDGKPRARVSLLDLETLWFNTGTLCNLQCKKCYIKSSPRNDYLEYLRLEEVYKHLKDIKNLKLNTKLVGFTGGEPFMNPDIIKMLSLSLSYGFNVLLLTNAMRPMMLKSKLMSQLLNRDRLTVRVSIDHYTKDKHERIRGENTWENVILGLKWLTNNNFNVTVASRKENGEADDTARLGFKKLFFNHNINIDAMNTEKLVLFPEMDNRKDVIEISDSCWDILKKSPEETMCSRSRMIVKKKHQKESKVLACTLITEDENFELGNTIQSAKKHVYLNHPFCSQFCVLGNSSCS